ncbi:copper homeostasis protein cutC isoform X1 [Biomphalaria pfeifferi]|uniref:Copper homeostasis protein cutC homolog n=1 Tax=Biomphalaria pfeifferi TaxID=112525 RepID=A0AAD8B9Y7_BIOPF|nr:copper homeostasis protein cutC isoform X1 [Biomphalaria pfeifferi]
MEVCVDSVQSAINAQAGGASRVELCANLMEGGTTPSIGLLKVIKSQITIPVFVMIRSRGGDFCYNDLEMEVMKEDLLALKRAGADGFVFGVLTQDGEVNAAACQSLLDIARPCPVTFHRAIDMARDIYFSLTTVINLGFDRILSSGGYNSALEGCNVLQAMVQQTQGVKTIVVPGGGIKIDNLEQILLKSQAKEFHGSARRVIDSVMTFRKCNLTMGSQPDIEFITKVTSTEDVSKMVSIYNSIYVN